MLALLLLAMPLAEVDAGRVLQALNEARIASGAPALRRLEALDATARMRAGRAAALPEHRRMSGGRGLDADLSAQGLREQVRSTEYTDLQRGYEDPTESLIARWRTYDRGWRIALDPDWSAFGAAASRAADGTIVFVAVLVEEPDAPVDLRDLEDRVVEAANAFRQREGRSVLVPSPALAEVARAHSEAMAGDGALYHVDPEGRGPGERVARAGIDYLRVAENVASNRRVGEPVETAMSGWEVSPGHRGNLLDDEVTHTGVGVALAPDGTYYFTQLFLLPGDRGGRR